MIRPVEQQIPVLVFIFDQCEFIDQRLMLLISCLKEAFYRRLQDKDEAPRGSGASLCWMFAYEEQRPRWRQETGSGSVQIRPVRSHFNPAGLELEADL